MLCTALLAVATGYPAFNTSAVAGSWKEASFPDGTHVLTSPHAAPRFHFSRASCLAVYGVGALHRVSVSVVADARGEDARGVLGVTRCDTVWV